MRCIASSCGRAPQEADVATTAAPALDSSGRPPVQTSQTVPWPHRRPDGRASWSYDSGPDATAHRGCTEGCLPDRHFRTQLRICGILGCIHPIGRVGIAMSSWCQLQGRFCFAAQFPFKLAPCPATSCGAGKQSTADAGVDRLSSSMSSRSKRTFPRNSTYRTVSAWLAKLRNRTTT